MTSCRSWREGNSTVCFAASICARRTAVHSDATQQVLAKARRVEQQIWCVFSVSRQRRSMPRRRPRDCAWALTRRNFLLTGKQGVKVLSAVLEYNSSLMHLDLSSNLICRDSGGFLAQVLKQRTCALQTLNLSNNPLDELGAKTLAAGLTLNKSLRKLGLSGCNIGDQGSPHFDTIAIKRRPPYCRFCCVCVLHRRSGPHCELHQG